MQSDNSGNGNQKQKTNKTHRFKIAPKKKGQSAKSGSAKKPVQAKQIKNVSKTRPVKQAKHVRPERQSKAAGLIS